ncbi:MAG: STAS domain-containing protein [bacterium]|nr:STAS domain-containing protein [bacterium]
MKIEVKSVSDDLIIVYLVDKFNIEHVSMFENQIKELYSRKVKTIAFDLSRMERIDSSAVGSLMKAKNQAKISNIEFILFNIPEFISAVFDTTYLNNFFDIRTREDLLEMYPEGHF